MNPPPPIRSATLTDVAAVRGIALETGLLSLEEWADVGSIMVDAVRGGLEGHAWIVVDDPAVGVVGAAYYAPEPFSGQVWNLYFLGVRPERQGVGIGGALVAHVEAVLRARGERVLIIETSGGEGFAATRAFYHGQGYAEEARIREFYGPDEDKVVFWKALYTAP